MRKALVVALFLLSGAAALAYQVSWTRHLVLVFGNTTRAVSLILAACRSAPLVPRRARSERTAP